MKKIRLILALCLLVSLMAPVKIAKANAPGAVVINEIAWMGTIASVNHEWIELYNTTDQNIDLAGWIIEDDDGAQTYTIANGVIAGKSYFLIEDAEEATSIPGDLITNLSLTNTGDKLVLKNVARVVIDTVNNTSGNWYAGNNDQKTTMERKDPLNLNDIAENWGNNVQGNGATDSLGNLIKGTVKGLNSIAVGNQAVNVTAKIDNQTPKNGDTITLSIEAQDVTNLFAYGIDLTYDKNILEFTEALKGNFLNDGGNIATSFNSGLENGQAGKVVIGEARTVENKTGKNGSGVLFTVKFKVIGQAGNVAQIILAQGSFLATLEGDLLCKFTNTEITVAQIAIVNPVQNLQANEGVNRYEMALSWEAPINGALSYKVLRKNAKGEFAELGITENLNSIDKKDLIPNINYIYQVIAQKGIDQSIASEVIQKETRGIKGDNNRSDRVDGRDLENLAKHFTETLDNPKFSALIDTTYDGTINGNDLIDIGVNWALTYAR